jgi:hypothetical protein
MVCVEVGTVGACFDDRHIDLDEPYCHRYRVVVIIISGFHDEMKSFMNTPKINSGQQFSVFHL